MYLTNRKRIELCFYPFMLRNAIDTRTTDDIERNHLRGMCDAAIRSAKAGLNGNEMVEFGKRLQRLYANGVHAMFPGLADQEVFGPEAPKLFTAVGLFGAMIWQKYPLGANDDEHVALKTILQLMFETFSNVDDPEINWIEAHERAQRLANVCRGEGIYKEVDKADIAQAAVH